MMVRPLICFLSTYNMEYNVKEAASEGKAIQGALKPA